MGNVRPPLRPFARLVLQGDHVRYLALRIRNHQPRQGRDLLGPGACLDGQEEDHPVQR